MISLKLLKFVTFEHSSSYALSLIEWLNGVQFCSFSRVWFEGGELGSCFRLGEVLDGEEGTARDPSIRPDILVGAGFAGGLPLPAGNAPERDNAGFCTAII